MTLHTLTLAFERSLMTRAGAVVPGAGVSFGLRPAGRLLAGLILLLLAGGLGTQLALLAGHDHLGGLVPLLDLNGEQNLPSWFSSVELLSASALLAGLAASDHLGRRWGWAGLAIVFLALSVDETAGLHERLNGPLRSALPLGPGLFFPWVVVGGLAVLGLAVQYGRFVLELPPPTRRLALASAAVFIAGALGTEAISAPFYALYGKQNLLNVGLVAIEESLEMTGVALFICALTGHAARYQARVALVFDDRSHPHRAAVVRISPRRFRSTLAVTIAVLGLLSLGGQFLVHGFGYPDTWGLARLVNVTREGNLPTWYQSATLLGCAALLAMVGGARAQAGEPFARHWQVLAVVFLYLSMDEAAGIHELSVRPLRAWLGAGGLLYYPWILLGGAFVLVLGGAYLRFLGALPRAIRNAMVLSAVLYVGGAIGVEALTAWHADVFGRANLQYAVLTTAEESLEMLGVMVFLVTLMSYLRDYVGPVRLGMASPGTDARPAPVRAVRNLPRPPRAKTTG